jgi:hypothetical protein
MASIRWPCLIFRHRLPPLPTDPSEREKLVKDLRVSLAFTYNAHGIDAALAQQRIRESLDSCRWSLPLILTILFSALIVGTIISESLFLG